MNLHCVTLRLASTLAGRRPLSVEATIGTAERTAVRSYSVVVVS